MRSPTSIEASLGFLAASTATDDAAAAAFYVARARSAFAVAMAEIDALRIVLDARERETARVATLETHAATATTDGGDRER